MEDSVQDYMDVDDPVEVDSLASTPIENYDSDQEWEVQDILAERVIHGETKYLISWAGFPLYDASWEPEEHLGETTISDWGITKARDGHRQKENERIKAWRRAVKDRLRSMAARKEARNLKRVERGLEPTELKFSLEDLLADLDDVPNGDDEIGVEDDVTTREIQNHGASLSSRKPSLSEPDLPYQAPAESRPQKTPQRKSSLPSSSRPHSDTVPRDHAPVSKKPAKTTLSSKLGANKVRKTSLETNHPQPAVRRTSLDTSNVFVGGKIRKKNPTLLDAAKDPTKQPKLLTHRLSRLIDKASRDREGVNPPARKPNLMSLNPEEKQQRLVGELGTSSHNPIASSVEGNHQTDISRQTQTGESDKPSKPAKKRKSVGFVLEPESIEPDPEQSLFLDGGLSPPRAEDNGKDQASEESNSLFTLPKVAVPSILKPILAVGSSHPTFVAKDAKLFPGATTSISLTFKLPAYFMPHWLSRLESEETLVFTHTCIATDFWQQVQIPQQIVRGTLTSSEHSRKLEATAHRLRLGSFGILCHLDEFCILVHPTKCEAWEAQNQDGEDYLLKFIMVNAEGIFRRGDLAPVSFRPDIGRQDLPPGAFPGIFSRVLGLEYSRLLPANLQSTTNHPFFLAFPSGAGQEEAKFVARWLRHCNPDCRIQTSHHNGHWSNFLTYSQGVVIIHEDAAWTIRLFPNLSKLLKRRPDNFTFWLFERSLKARPLVPRENDAPAEIGDIRLQPIFEHGVVILITPSFFVSHSHEALAFMRWFQRTRGNDTHPRQRPRFIVCAGIVNWLHNLATERSDRMGTVSIYSRPHVSKAAEAIYISSALARRVVEALDQEDSDMGSFIFAPDSIDGNDEQSLVNWFGWWSIMNMSQYREFAIMGSDNPHAATLARQMRCPRFKSSTTGDPDEVYRQLDQEEEQKQFTKVGQLDPRDSGTSFRLVANDAPFTLVDHFDHLIKRVFKKPCPIILYKFPVSYWNNDMSFHFRDYKLRFASYQKCFDWFSSFKAPPHHQNIHTAFFYTIEGKWDAAAYPQGVMPPRRPWLGFHRPPNNKKSPSASELLIWDLTRSQNLSRGRYAYEGDLIEAQREFIRVFSEENRAKNPGQPITKVWVGGFEASWRSHTNQLDATLSSLQHFADEIRERVPLSEQFMSDGGWKLVKPGLAPESESQSTDAMEIDEPGSEEDDDKKMVFHPPRGSIGRPTNCHNHLYNCTKDSLRKQKSRPDDWMEFKFRPTLTWYQEQLAEGRGYEHISVWTFKELSDRYDIGYESI
ncbi:hypothetical protein B0T10DRAFT_191781 [Thelonectria olida]|uniref:Chromo domain-containing protein n=1 Tax=Thelonectria olida TaxID=1576542 RepID=A0A9P9AKL3_9HYPO|nr:hypothetical protein B0T10DRAFT_191781 [Thelonectria olida]